VRYQTAPHSDKKSIIDRKKAPLLALPNFLVLHRFFSTAPGGYRCQKAARRKYTLRTHFANAWSSESPKLPMKLKILVGTMTHTAEHVAQAIQMECADLASPIDVESMESLDIDVFNAEKCLESLFLVCISTYGAGDVPDNAQMLYQSLETHARFLGHIRYGVIALGDSMAHAQTYGFGGKRFDERLQDLGAQRLGDICLLDSSDGTLPEAMGAEWCRVWLQAAQPQTQA